MKEIVIFGTGGHAKVIYDILLKQNKYKVVGFVSQNENLNDFLTLPHYKQSQLATLNVNAGVVAIGDNHVRSEVVALIQKTKASFEFVTAVHPSAQLAHGVKIGAGSVVMANVCINSDSQIGEHCILNTASSVDHDCVMGSFSSIAPKAVTGGNVSIGQFSAVSIAAVVKHGIKIGQHAVIGAAAVVLKDVPDFKVAYGNPCKEVKNRKAGDKYL